MENGIPIISKNWKQRIIGSVKSQNGNRWHDFRVIPPTYLCPMQHREIFSPKYFRDIAKQYDLGRDVPGLTIADFKSSVECSPTSKIM